MIYTSEKTLDVWVANREKQLFKLLIFTTIFYSFMGIGVYFNTNKEFNKSFFLGTIMLFFILLFVLFSSRFNSNIVNRTINKIEVNAENIVFKTYSFNFLNIYNFNEKSISKELHCVNFSLTEYPLKGDRNKLDRECFNIKIDNEEYYLLYKYFENELIDILKTK